MADSVVVTNLAKWLEQAIEEHAPKQPSHYGTTLELQEVRVREAILVSALESANAQLSACRELTHEKVEALQAANEREQHLADLVEKYRGILLEAKLRIEAAETRAARAEQELALRRNS